MLRIVCNTCRSFGTSYQYIIYILFFLLFMVGLFPLHWPYSNRTCHAFDCLLCVTFTATKLTDVANLSAFNIHTYIPPPTATTTIHFSHPSCCQLKFSSLFSKWYFSPFVDHIHGILCDLILVFSDFSFFLCILLLFPVSCFFSYFSH